MKLSHLHTKLYLNLNIFLNRFRKDLDDNMVIKYYKLKDMYSNHDDIINSLSKTYKREELINWICKSDEEKLEDYNHILNERHRVQHEKYKSQK